MTGIAYHASHEQFAPSELLRYAVLAEQAGFTAIHSSDHFHPWSGRQGQSGFSFAWMGAAMQATTLPFGVVCSPAGRYHPAIVAQAIATLGQLFPRRLWISLGSGEALNENITGNKWPPKAERNARLQESYHIIKRLLSGEMVSHSGRVTVENARLYTLPSQSPLLLGAAVTETTAAWMGSWTDGLITISRPYNALKKVVEAYRNSGGQGKPIYLKVQLSYSRSEEQALAGAYDQWRTNIFSESLCEDIGSVAQFDAMAQYVKPDDMSTMVRISSDFRQHIEWIRSDMALGFEQIILHNVNREQEQFIRDFGEYVIQKL